MRACACVSVFLSVFFILFCFLLFVCLFVSLDFLNPLQEIGVASQQPQEQRYPFLPVCVAFLCPTLWLQSLGIFIARADVDACDYTRAVQTPRESVCAES